MPVESDVDIDVESLDFDIVVNYADVDIVVERSDGIHRKGHRR
jgi:hypothetical protein